MLKNREPPRDWTAIGSLLMKIGRSNKKNITFRERERYSSGKLVNKECQKIAVTTVVAKK
jgi:hypothetical protein